MTLLADDLAARAMTMGTAVVSNMSRWYSNGVFLGDQQTIWPHQTFKPAALLATLVKFNAAYSTTYIQMIREIMARVQETAMGNGLAFDTPGFLPYGGYPRLPPPDNLHVFSSDAQMRMYDYYVMGPTRASMQGQPPVNRFGVDGLNMIESCHPLAFMIYQLPASSITTFERTLWTSWCQAMCDYLDSQTSGNGLTYFYVNGNYQARLCQAYWYTSMISAPGPTQDKYRDMYERALEFTVNPFLHNASWLNYGWVTTLTGSNGDWSDYKGYLTENGSSLGLDWVYSTVQAEALAGIYLMNRDERVLRMLNAISTNVEPRINQTTWILDGTGGTRQTGSNYGQWLFYPFLQGLLGRKQANTTMLTSIKLLDFWDHNVGGDGGVTGQLLTPTTNGSFYGISPLGAWYTTIAMTREAAYQARIRVPAV